MKQTHKEFLFYVVIISLVEILCAVGLMRLATPLYLKGAKLCTIEHGYKTNNHPACPKDGHPPAR